MTIERPEAQLLRSIAQALLAYAARLDHGSVAPTPVLPAPGGERPSRRPPPVPVADPWLTLREAAAETQISMETLRLASTRGHLRTVRINGHRSPYRIRRSWLDAYLENQRSGQF